MILEAALLTILIVLLASASYTDWKSSIIMNRHLITALVPAVILDSVYYLYAGSAYRSVFTFQFTLLSVLAVILYACHLWGAGDSKLLMLVGLCIPGRFYTFWDSTLSSSLFILVLVFSFAFLYVAAESIVLSVRNHSLFSFEPVQWDYKRAVVSYFAMVGSLLLLNLALSHILTELFLMYPVLIPAVNFVLLLAVVQLREKLSTYVLTVSLVPIWLLLSAAAVFRRLPVRIAVDLKSWGLVLFVMVLRVLAEKYNYRVIPTSEVKEGQILSEATVLSFTSSRIQGLPTGRTEDLRSRLTPEEAESVRRWERSAHGKPWVVIVRKIPFAIFIALGSAVFLVMEVVMQ